MCVPGLIKHELTIFERCVIGIISARTGKYDFKFILEIKFKYFFFFKLLKKET